MFPALKVSKKMTEKIGNDAKEREEAREKKKENKGASGATKK